jgi:hypothetical protein
MPSVVQKRRGRPRKPPPPPRPPLAVGVPRWSKDNNQSQQTTRRKIKAGEILVIQRRPGEPYKIPVSEYIRHGIIKSINELIR